MVVLRQLKVFHIGGNEIGDDGAIALASCVHNIEEIYMFRCNITNIGAEDLGKAIAEMQHSVIYLFAFPRILIRNYR